MMYSFFPPKAPLEMPGGKGRSTSRASRSQLSLVMPGGI